jgi:hypothetical protein
MQLTVTHVPDNSYRLTGTDEDPREINYDLKGLHKKKQFRQGELESVEYYQNFAPPQNGYQGLCVKEFNTYYRMKTFIFMREKRIEWYRMDGSVGCTKTTTKYYELSESMQEGFTRRNNCIYQAAERILPKIGIANTQELIAALKNEIENYERGFESQLVEAIRQLPRAYLDLEMEPGLSVRTWLAGELAIVYQ